ncbi:hypothetical protein A9798_02580 [Edwardsiella hoshinae]|uniref:Uncharacterized protein n=2 Tax=Edwardsiella hoshinae TaxID=93378 RepID=A0ABM6EG56_9GAMM|nr:hypothetical protein A9798_02580 [Edwardsiella hoshinae]
MSYGQLVAYWNQYADAKNLTPEQKQAGLDKLAKGELLERFNISKVIVDGYKEVTWSNTQVSAGEHLALASGDDTHLRGARSPAAGR